MIKNLMKYLYFWVLVGMLAGSIIGMTLPEFGVSLLPIGEGFIALIKMLIGPIIFCTIVLGIAGAGNIKQVGRIGWKALLYFEVISLFSLMIGLGIAHLLKPGKNFHVDLSKLDTALVFEYSKKANDLSINKFLSHLIPKTFIDAFTNSGDVLQILVISIIFGYSLNRIGKKSELVYQFIDSVSHVFFNMINIIMKLAPIGAASAMAFTIGKFGIQSIGSLGYLIFCFYLSCLIFIFLILGTISYGVGFKIHYFLYYIREELFTVLGTSSSESALIHLMKKLEKLGCKKDVVSLVVPAGYSFNLDGTSIYLTLVSLFIAQAFKIDLSAYQQFQLLSVAMLTSKGASGVTGSGFVTLAATFSIIPEMPIEGLALILGIDRFMSESRALTNIIGNGVATIVISAWEKKLDRNILLKELGTLRS